MASDPGMSADGVLFRLAAFAEEDGGGNPAGVWMAREIGYSETAFLSPGSGRKRRVRYFSPLAEVPFCGHATIASGAVLGRLDGAGTFELETPAGRVRVDVSEQNGAFRAALTSVDTTHRPLADPALADILRALGWLRSDLDPGIPAATAFAGAWHAVIAAAERERLAALDYDFDRLREVMLALELTTVQLVWREDAGLYHSRNPFPVGGVVEDPATGAAAAAFGGYLRDAGLAPAPASVVIRQGDDMGRPSVLHVDIPTTGGIVVAGAVREIDAPDVP